MLRRSDINQIEILAGREWRNVPESFRDIEISTFLITRRVLKSFTKPEGASAEGSTGIRISSLDVEVRGVAMALNVVGDRSKEILIALHCSEKSRSTDYAGRYEDFILSTPEYFLKPNITPL